MTPPQASRRPSRARGITMPAKFMLPPELAVDLVDAATLASARRAVAEQIRVDDDGAIRSAVRERQELADALARMRRLLLDQ